MLQSEITEMQLQLKRAGEDREGENKDFQATVSDQRETQKLLTSAQPPLESLLRSELCGERCSQLSSEP